MLRQPPSFLVDPDPVEVQPPGFWHVPPSLKRTPPPFTVQPPPVSYGGRRYNPPPMRIAPPEMVIDLQPVWVQPSPMTLRPSPILVAPPAIEVDWPIGHPIITLDPPPVRVDPPPFSVDPPAVPVTPPKLTVRPPSFKVRAPSFSITVGLPGLPARQVTLEGPEFSVDPPPFEVTPGPVIVTVPPLTIDPPGFSVDPPPFTVSVNEIQWGTPRFQTLRNNGDPANRLDVVIIGDGFTAAQQAEFQGRADDLVQAFVRIEPMSTYIRHFNFHRVDVISDEDGTDDMFADPPRIRRTALHTFYSPLAGPEEALGDGGRRLLGPDPWVRQVVHDSGAPCDEIIVLINSPRHGGATAPSMEIAYASIESDFPDIAIHEAGHSIADLMDEYDDLFPDINWPADWVLPVDPPWVNVDTNPSPPKWHDWLTPGVDLPTAFPAPDGTVGAFEGAAYSKSAVYRPTATCFMRDNKPSYPPFCVVCAEAWIASIYRRSRPADRFMPRPLTRDESLTTRAGRPMTFGAQVVRPEAIETTWLTRLRGENRWHEQQRTPAYQGFTTTFDAPGRYEVRVVLRDGTDRIRSLEVRALATQENIWRVTAL